MDGNTKIRLEEAVAKSYNNHFHPIRQEQVYPISREQWTGFEDSSLERSYEIHTKERIVLGIGPETVIEHLPFVTLAMGFVKPEGDAAVGYMHTPEAAWKVFDVMLKDYLNDKPGIIFWRRVPTLCTEIIPPDIVTIDRFGSPLVRYELGGATRYVVSCRLAVTKKRDFIPKSAFEEFAS